MAEFIEFARTKRLKEEASCLSLVFSEHSGEDGPLRQDTDLSSLSNR